MESINVVIEDSASAKEADGETDAEEFHQQSDDEKESES
ncbi:hypothetical protein A2U01_0092051, partial [Trifolium medium]|nr:hypothetical protein [Trifolium medium]